MKKRNQTLRKKAFKRDNFTCRKCDFEDLSGKKLEAHHIVPLYLGGKGNLDNLITLCFDCHYFCPDKKEEFEEYTKEECDGTLTTLIKAWNKVREEHPGLFENKK